MMKKKIHILFYAGLFFVLLLSGCKSVKRIGTVGADELKEHQDFFDSMKEQAIQYETLSARLNVEITTPDKSLSSRVDLKMIKDSAFQLSVVPMLGIEMFRIEIGRDSVKVLDRLNKRYVAESFQNMKGDLPIGLNFYSLQALFTNHIFLPGESEVKTQKYNRFKLTKEGPTVTAKTRDDLDLMYTFTADGEEKLLAFHVSDKKERYNLYWDYKDFRIVQDRVFPMLMDVKIVTDNKQPGKAVLAFGRVDVNVPLKLEFSIPSRYQRVTFAQVVKSLSKSRKE